MPVSSYTLKTRAEVDERSNDWFSLAEQLYKGPPFCRPETWVPALKSLLNVEGYQGADSVKAVIFELRVEDRLLGVLPLYRSGRYLLSLSENYIDYQDVLAKDTEVSKQLLKSAIDHALKEKLIYIAGHVRKSNLLYEAINESIPLKTAWLCKRYFGSCIISNFDLKTPSEAGLLSVIPRRQRRNYKSCKKRMSLDEATFKTEHLWGTEISEEHIEAIGRLHRKNQYHRSGRSPFADPLFLRFLSLQAQSQHALLLSLLKREDDLVAFSVGYGTESDYFYYITDYEKEHAHLAPGSYLLIAAIVAVIERFKPEHYRLDMLLGSEAYKSQWETDHYFVDRIVIIPKTASLLPFAAAYRLTYFLKSIKNRVLGIGDCAQKN